VTAEAKPEHVRRPQDAVFSRIQLYQDGVDFWKEMDDSKKKLPMAAPAPASHFPTLLDSNHMEISPSSCGI
jgi:hypothetical protein